MMTEKIQNFIFDWSGVISDDFHYVYLTYRKIFEYYNKKPMKKEEFKQKFKLPYMEFCREHLGKTNEKELAEIFRKIYSKNQFTPQPIKGTKEVLIKLKKINKKLFVLSSHSFVSKEAQKYFNGNNPFDKIYEDIPNKEEAIESILDEMGIQKKQTIYIGDMTHDIKAGKKAGIKTAAVLTGYQAKKLLVKENPDYILNSLNDIFSVLPI